VRWIELYVGCMSFSVAANMQTIWRAKISATTTIYAEFGLCAITPNNQADRIFWTASSALGTTWQARTSSASSLSTRDTTLTMDTNWHEFKIVTSTGAVTFFLDNVPYAPLTTNISSALMAPYMRINSVSRVARTLYVDSVETLGDRE
jgi:hypothetical protein